MARGAIAGASALLSSFEELGGDSVVQGLGCCRRLPCSPPGQPLARRVSEQGSAAVSYLSVVQDLGMLPVFSRVVLVMGCCTTRPLEKHLGLMMK